MTSERRRHGPMSTSIENTSIDSEWLTVHNNADGTSIARLIQTPPWQQSVDLTILIAVKHKSLQVLRWMRRLTDSIPASTVLQQTRRDIWPRKCCFPVAMKLIGPSNDGATVATSGSRQCRLASEKPSEPSTVSRHETMQTAS
uniref:Uncharacterized protein n=1 Tax=Panagrellus redivivus TaxID=6233 RepID=A0A7E4UV76_PANRE